MDKLRTKLWDKIHDVLQRNEGKEQVLDQYYITYSELKTLMENTHVDQ